MDLFNKKRITIGVIVLLGIFWVISMILAYYFYNSSKSFDCKNLCNEEIYYETNEKNGKNYFVEIKGAVKKPGVYELSEDNIINDLVNLAGGFTKNAYTNNINLSRKIKDELVLYVYTKTEYKKKKEKDDVTKITTCSSNDYYIDNCTKDYISIIESNESKTDVESNNNINSDSKEDEKTKVNSKININTATLEEFMKLNGVGEAKAKLIIDYRNQNGFFKNIDEIKNVKGIGDAMYEKIKDSITV